MHSDATEAPLATNADRKVVLMRLLALAEAERLGLEPSPAQLRETTRWFRASFGLRSLDRFAAWLAHSGFDLPRFEHMMRELSILTLVLEHWGEAVDARIGDHLALHTARSFPGARHEG